MNQSMVIFLLQSFKPRGLIELGTEQTPQMLFVSTTTPLQHLQDEHINGMFLLALINKKLMIGYVKCASYIKKAVTSKLSRIFQQRRCPN